MKKELEKALEGLLPCSHKVCEGICPECQHEKNYNLIKSALERLEKVETENTELKSRNKKLEEFYDLIKKDPKELVYVYINDDYKEYMEHLAYYRIHKYNEEQFNYLKEMLEEK